MRPLQEKTNPNPSTDASQSTDSIPMRREVTLVVAINKLETVCLVVIEQQHLVLVQKSIFRSSPPRQSRVRCAPENEEQARRHQTLQR